MTSYNTMVSVLTNLQGALDPQKAEIALIKLRTAFTTWQQNRLEAEERRRILERDASKKKDLDEKVVNEIQEKIKSSIKFILEVEKRKGKLTRNPMNMKEIHPFYYLGFHPSAIPNGQNLKTIVKDTRKLLSKLTHPDKLRANNDVNKSDANEAFRLAAEAVKNAMKLVNIPETLQVDLTNFVCAPWISSLDIEEHTGTNSKAKAGRPKQRATRKRGRDD